MSRTQSPLTDASTPIQLPRKVSFWAVFSWALYDLANTIYSAAVVSIYFPAFIKDDLNANDAFYAIPSAVAALLVGLFSPLMGRISDRGGNRMRWLAISTLLNIGAVFIMGFFPLLAIAIFFFVIANSMYQAALMFYDALLPSVSSPANWGKVGGLGVGLGYFGGITGFLLVPIITKAIFGTAVQTVSNTDGTPQIINSFGQAVVREDILNSNTFLVTAALYLIFSIPCLLFVKEKQYTQKREIERVTFKSSLSQTWRSLQEARKYPGLFIFLVSNFFYSDAVNTVIVAMGIYSTQVIGFTNAERNNFLAFSTIFAVLGSFIFGYVNDKIGAKISMNITLGIWSAVFIFAISAPPKELFFFIGGPVSGVALGSTWVAARTLMIELTPPDRLGEFMGIYNLTGRFAAVIGPLIWGITLLAFDPAAGWGALGYQLAVGMLFVVVLVGFGLHQLVPNINRKERGAEYINSEQQAAAA